MARNIGNSGNKPLHRGAVPELAINKKTMICGRLRALASISR
jgi:hypothetical protein